MKGQMNNQHTVMISNITKTFLVPLKRVQLYWQQGSSLSALTKGWRYSVKKGFPQNSGTYVLLFLQNS